MKKVLSILLAVCLTVAAIPAFSVSAKAENILKNGDFSNYSESALSNATVAALNNQTWIISQGTPCKIESAPIDSENYGYTSSVVATGYAFSEGAGDFATMVKLTRTLAIIPTVITFAFVQLRLKRKEALDNSQNGSELKANFSITKIFPWFILGFLVMSIVASVFPIPAAVVSGTKSASKFLMVCALAAIGLNTSFSSMKKAGIRPMIHGFIISALVVIVALVVEIAMGIVS